MTNISFFEGLKEIAQWSYSNLVKSLIMKSAASESYIGTMTEETNAKRFLEVVELHFVESEKADTIMFLHKLLSLRYNGLRSTREHIIEISYIMSKLMTLKLEVLEDMMVYLIWMSFLPQFS